MMRRSMHACAPPPKLPLESYASSLVFPTAAGAPGQRLLFVLKLARRPLGAPQREGKHTALTPQHLRLFGGDKSLSVCRRTSCLHGKETRHTFIFFFWTGNSFVPSLFRKQSTWVWHTNAPFLLFASSRRGPSSVTLYFPLCSHPLNFIIKALMGENCMPFFFVCVCFFSQP